jgi:hypothetical protein
MTVGVVTLKSNDMATVGEIDFVLMMKWRIFDNLFHPLINFIHRKTKRELQTTCKCNFMALRVLMKKKMLWQGGEM